LPPNAHPTAKDGTEVIAIDGPAAAGKTTVGRLVADRLGFLHIPSGLIYRAVALAATDEEIALGDQERLVRRAERLALVRKGTRLCIGTDTPLDLDRSSTGRHAAQIARLGGVRDVLTARIRELAAEGPCVVDGRDIGTVVFPQARLKIFLDADIEVRAERRSRQTGRAVPAERSALDIRDREDHERKLAPLRAAADAAPIDTSDQTIEQTVDLVSALWSDSGSRRR
jgi:cytidylate kinase